MYKKSKWKRIAVAVIGILIIVAMLVTMILSALI